MYKSKHRPGVFSTYTISDGGWKKVSKRAVGLVSTSLSGECGKVYKFTRLSELYNAFGSTGNMYDMGEILFGAGISKIYAIGVDEQSKYDEGLYGEAFELLELFEDIGAVVCDSDGIEVHKLLKASMDRCSESFKERIGFCCADVDECIGHAKQLDSERMCVASPLVSYKQGTRGCYLAAVYAAMCLGSVDVAQNLNMGEFSGDFSYSSSISEEQIDNLIENGVAVFEHVENGVRLVRAITTKSANGDGRHGLGELSTVMIIDDVMMSIRDMLKSKLSGAKNSQSTLESIKTQTTLILDKKLDDEIISAYETPLVYISEEDSSICVVEIGFNVMHVMHRINLMAYITV